MKLTFKYYMTDFFPFFHFAFEDKPNVKIKINVRIKALWLCTSK